MHTLWLHLYARSGLLRLRKASHLPLMPDVLQDGRTIVFFRKTLLMEDPALVAALLATETALCQRVAEVPLGSSSAMGELPVAPDWFCSDSCCASPLPSGSHMALESLFEALCIDPLRLSLTRPGAFRAAEKQHFHQ